MDMRGANRRKIKDAAKFLAKENDKWPYELSRLSKELWPDGALHSTDPPIEIWRSKEFLVQIFPVSYDEDMERLSINRCDLDLTSGHWREDISWDDLQRLKSECGRGCYEAVEIYPTDSNIVNVANMRHLWIFKRDEWQIPFSWRTKR